MYYTCKQGRINDALDDVERRYKAQDEIAKLKVDLKLAQDDLKQVVEEKQVTLALNAKAEQALIEARAELEDKKKLGASTCNMHKCLRLKAEQERDKLKEEKRKLEHFIAELMKHNEGARSKLRKIKEICDE
jgi:NH3-dependent NAD+ synthetase